MRIIKDKIKAFESQLATDHNERPPNLHPARVVSSAGAKITSCRRYTTSIGFGGKPVAGRIIYFDNLPVQIQREGNVHRLAENEITEGARHTGLAISRRAIQKYGSTGIERRSQPLKSGFRNHQLRKDLPHGTRGDCQMSTFLATNRFVIDLKWYWCLS